MTVLICRQAEVRAHWEQTVAILRKILPESGGHYVPRAKADIFDVELAIGNADVETTLRYDGRTIPIVPFLDMPAGQPSTYWLAWHEGWRSPQVGGGREKRQFRSSSIAIYAGSPGSNKSQVLRAEWAGAEAVIVRGKPQYTFQGQGAAHPHWHLAGLENNTPGGSDGLAGFEVAETAPVGLAAFADAGGNTGPVQDRTAAFEANTSTQLSSIEPAWASIHLATSARWAQTEWPGPSGPHDTHAVDPATCGEIRSWIVSCVRYLQSELQGQVLRGRR